MKMVRVFLLSAGVLGGGALWLGMKDSEAAKARCRYCGSDGKCHVGTSMTCKSGYNAPERPWCVSSSGCVFTT